MSKRTEVHTSTHCWMGQRYTVSYIFSRKETFKSNWIRIKIRLTGGAKWKSFLPGPYDEPGLPQIHEPLSRLCCSPRINTAAVVDALGGPDCCCSFPLDSGKNGKHPLNTQSQGNATSPVERKASCKHGKLSGSDYERTLTNDEEEWAAPMIIPRVGRRS